MRPLSSVLILVLLAGIAPSQVMVEDRSGRVVSGTPLGLEAGRLLVRPTGEDRPRALDWVLLNAPSGPAPDPDAPADALFLEGAGAGAGEWLLGRITGGDAFGVRLSVEGSVSFEVPFERIERLLPRVRLPIDRLLQLEGGGADDRLWQRLEDGTLDGVHGVVDRLDADGVELESALGTLSLAWDGVVALVFAEPEAGADLPAGPRVLVRLAGGSRFEANLLDLRDGRVVLGTRFAPDLELPLEALGSLVRLGEERAVLADLAPVAVEEWPSLGEPQDFLFPWRHNLSVTGRPLTVGGVPRATGLGVHANARLAFELPAGIRALRVTVGLVDEVLELPAEASVLFELRVDGELRASAGPLREGSQPAVLHVGDLQGARRLELTCLDAGDDDAGDRAAWVDGILFLDSAP